MPFTLREKAGIRELDVLDGTIIIGTICQFPRQLTYYFCNNTRKIIWTAEELTEITKLLNDLNSGKKNLIGNLNF